MPLTESLSFPGDGGSVPLPVLKDGKSTTEFKGVAVGTVLAALGVLLSFINPHWHTHLALTPLDQTVITSILGASVPVQWTIYAWLRTQAKKYHLGVVGSIIQQQIITSGQKVIAANSTPAAPDPAAAGTAPITKP